MIVKPETFSTLPDFVRTALDAAQRIAANNLSIINEMLGENLTMHFICKKQPSISCFEDDRETSCSGTDCNFVWVVPIFRKLEDDFDEYKSWKGGGHSAIYQTHEIAYRDSDFKINKIGNGYSEIRAANLQLHPAHDADSRRIHYSNYGLCKLNSGTLAEIAERFRVTKRRKEDLDKARDIIAGFSDKE